MEKIEFKILTNYKNTIEHGITCKGQDFIHIDINSTNFIQSKIKLAEELNIKEDDLFFINQVHGKELRIINEKSSNEINEYDGLITNCSNKLLATCYADCVPLLFFDPVKKVIASVHSGWKGTVAEIGKNTVETICREYKSNRENIIACIGPSIGVCCFEVSKDVWEIFNNKFPTSTVEEKGKYKVNLWQANKEQLLKIGIQEENIEISGVCTCCNNDKFYSYRKGDKEKGRFMAYIMLKKNCD